jgi:hypothetical protein
MRITPAAPSASPGRKQAATYYVAAVDAGRGGPVPGDADIKAETKLLIISHADLWTR